MNVSLGVSYRSVISANVRPLRLRARGISNTTPCGREFLASTHHRDGGR